MSINRELRDLILLKRFFDAVEALFRKKNTKKKLQKAKNNYEIGLKSAFAIDNMGIKAYFRL